MRQMVVAVKHVSSTYLYHDGLCLLILPSGHYFHSIATVCSRKNLDNECGIKSDSTISDMHS